MKAITKVVGKRAKIEVSELELEEKLITLDRVTKVVKGGKRLRFRALVAVGDGRGHVGIGLAKATKILHLKRPNLFPVLDSFVINFLLGINVSSVEKRHQLDIGIQALEKTREIMIKQKGEFEKLIEQTRDLPIPLTPIRMFDILCWTTEKWDIRK